MSEEAATMKTMKSRWAAVRGRWSNLPVVDWIAALLVVAIYAFAVWKWDAPQFADLSKADRMRAYTTLATVSSLLFGFATASIAFFYGSARGERVELLKKYFGKRLVASWRGALSAPLLAVAFTVAALVLDTRQAGNPVIQWVIATAVALLAFRCIRLRWLFTSTLTLMASDADDDGPKERKIKAKLAARVGAKAPQG